MSFLINPFLEKGEIKSVRVLILLFLKPYNKERKMVLDLLSIENPINHMATKESHFDLVSCMAVDFLVLVDNLENVRSG